MFSPNGRTIVTRSGDERILWDATTAERIGSLKTLSYEFSPDGRTVLTYSGGQTLLLDAATAKAVGRPLRQQGFWSGWGGRFSPDGHSLLTVGMARWCSGTSRKESRWGRPSKTSG